MCHILKNDFTIFPDCQFSSLICIVRLQYNIRTPVEFFARKEKIKGTDKVKDGDGGFSGEHFYFGGSGVRWKGGRSSSYPFYLAPPHVFLPWVRIFGVT